MINAILRRGSARNFVCVTLACLGILGISQCASQAPTDGEKIDQVPSPLTGCNSDTWCRTLAKKPCADNTLTKCVVGECIYTLKISQTPPNLCIAGDIRACTLPGSGGCSSQGVETCTAVSGTGGGCNWGGCGPL